MNKSDTFLNLLANSDSEKILNTINSKMGNCSNKMEFQLIRAASVMDYLERILSRKLKMRDLRKDAIVNACNNLKFFTMRPSLALIKYLLKCLVIQRQSGAKIVKAQVTKQKGSNKNKIDQSVSNVGIIRDDMVTKDDHSICTASVKPGTWFEDVDKDESPINKVDRWISLKDKEGKSKDRLNKNEDSFRIREDTELSTYSMDNSLISKEDLSICDASFKADKIQMSIPPGLFNGSDAFQSSGLNTVELLTGLEDVNMDESSIMKVDRWIFLKDKEGKNND